jgi:dTDP-4-dehydrorhamnose reductase
LHVSTDYVFNGEASQPYTEEDKTDPINKYGASKLLGEELAAKENPESLIIRTSWVYSIYANNFVKTMRRLMGERENIGVVNDQWGAPTYAMDLAACMLKIVCKETWHAGTYHFSNKGNITWYEFSLLIKEMGNYTCKVNPITTEQFPTPAKRPHYSVLDSRKIAKQFDIVIRDWKVALKEAMESF